MISDGKGRKQDTATKPKLIKREDNRKFIEKMRELEELISGMCIK